MCVALNFMSRTATSFTLIDRRMNEEEKNESKGAEEEDEQESERNRWEMGNIGKALIL